MHLISEAFEQEPRAAGHGKPLRLRDAPMGRGQQPPRAAPARGSCGRSAPPDRCCQLQTLETHVCVVFEERLIACYQGHWEPVLSSILIMVWVFKPARSNTFWVLLPQNLYVFYQNVSSNAHNTNLYTPAKLDDSFWVAQFFSHPLTLSELAQKAKYVC